MMSSSSNERRQHARHETEAKVYCTVSYDLKTKVRFQIIDQIRHTFMSKKYFAISKNIGVSGIGIFCDQELSRGSLLKLEVYIPGIKKPVLMEGEVRWAAANPFIDETIKKIGLGKYEIGIKLSVVNGERVDPTIHYDERYQLEWSVVLESVLGNYRIEAQKRQSN